MVWLRHCELRALRGKICELSRLNLMSYLPTQIFELKFEALRAAKFKLTEMEQLTEMKA